MQVFLLVVGENGEGYNVISVHQTQEGAIAALLAYTVEHSYMKWIDEGGCDFIEIIAYEVSA